MLTAPVVAFVDPYLIPGMLIMLGTTVTLLVTVREREHIDLHGTGWALVGRVPGTVAGAVLVSVLPARGLALMLACVVLVGVVLTTFGWAPPPRRRNLVMAGTASGLLGTATSIGGPPMALIWHRNSGARMRGTMSGFFLVGSAISLTMLAVTGSITGHAVWVYLLMLPSALAGYALSRHVNRILAPTQLRLTAIVVSVLGAVLVIVKQSGLI